MLDEKWLGAPGDDGPGVERAACLAGATEHEGFAEHDYSRRVQLDTRCLRRTLAPSATTNGSAAQIRHRSRADGDPGRPGGGPAPSVVRDRSCDVDELQTGSRRRRQCRARRGRRRASSAVVATSATRAVFRPVSSTRGVRWVVRRSSLGVPEGPPGDRDGGQAARLSARGSCRGRANAPCRRRAGAGSGRRGHAPCRRPRGSAGAIGPGSTGTWSPARCAGEQPAHPVLEPLDRGRVGPGQARSPAGRRGRLRRRRPSARRRPRRTAPGRSC